MCKKGFKGRSRDLCFEELGENREKAEKCADGEAPRRRLSRPVLPVCGDMTIYGVRNLDTCANMCFLSGFHLIPFTGESFFESYLKRNENGDFSEKS